MSKGSSVAEMLTDLQKRIAHHQERSAFHAQQEAHHREQHAFHDAELAKALQRHDALKTAAEAASDYTEPPASTPLPAAEEEIPRFGKKPMVSKLVARVVERQKEDETFGAHAIAAEVNQRYSDELDIPVSPKLVSVTLRRLLKRRRIHETRAGRATQEALYVRGGPPTKR